MARNGGPAFPQALVTYPDGSSYHTPDVAENCGGMSLRDWFAGMALAGICAHPESGTNAQFNAALAVEHADAMMEARDANG